MPSRRLRFGAGLALLIVLSVDRTTLATWSGSAVLPGTSMTTGRLDVNVNGQDAPSAFAALTTATLVPGGSVAGVMTVRNAGNVPLGFTVAVTGTNADGKGLAAALVRTFTTATTSDGTTCGGSTLGATTSLAVGASTPVCVQLALSSSAPVTLAGATSNLTVMVQGTVRNAWTDDAPAAGSHVGTAQLTAPVISCAGPMTVKWDAVPGATGYRVYLAGVQVQQLPAGTLTATLGSVGVVTVRAVFGSASWVSPDSNSQSLLAC